MESGKKILIIESDEKRVAQIEQILAGYYLLSVAFTHAQGLKEAASESRPDLIVLSVLENPNEAYELCRQLKNGMKTFSIPILLVLTHSQESSEYFALEHGAVDFLPFPFVEGITVTRIETHLKLSELEERIEQLEVRDKVTGLYNRTYIEKYFDQEWRRARRTESPLGLILIEIDGFDEYNEHYGISEVEEMLRKISSLINTQLKRPADMAARYGVKGFVCVVPETDFPGLRQLAEEILCGVSQSGIKHEFFGIQDHLTVSIAVDYAVPVNDLNSSALFLRVKSLLGQRSVDESGMIILPN